MVDKGLDRMLSVCCEKALKFDGGTNGPQHAIGRQKDEGLFLDEAFDKTAFNYFRDERDVFYNAIIKIKAQ